MNTNQETKEEQTKNLKTSARGGFIAVAMAMVLFGASACSTLPTVTKTENASATPQAAPPAKTTIVSNVPKPLEEVGHFSENVYDMAKLNDWGKASADLASLKQATGQLKTDARTAKVDAAQLTASLAKVDNAVAKKNRAAAMEEANRITMIAANLTASFKPQVPTEVTLLDYYGRELEIWAEAKNPAKLKTTATEIRRTWDKLRPSVESHGGTGEVKKFSDLAARVEAAKTPDEYARLATPVLDEVDNLEKVFTK